MGTVTDAQTGKQWEEGQLSSYYSNAQLEEMRKQKLRQELADSIQALKEQLMNILVR